MRTFYQSHLYQNFVSLFSTVIKTARRNAQGKKFEPEVEALSRLIKEGDICLDVGGAYGRYAFPLSKIVGPQGKIYSFEPGSYSYTVFWWMKLFFNLRNVVLIKKAVSDTPGQINLCLPLKGSGKLGTSLAYIDTNKDGEAYYERVDRITLDNLNQQVNFPQVNLIKCDVEGSELLVFKGARRLIEKFKPIVLTEIDEGNMSRYGLTVPDMLNFFFPLKYRLMTWDGTKFIAAASIDSPGNYFFIPPQISL